MWPIDLGLRFVFFFLSSLNGIFFFPNVFFPCVYPSPGELFSSHKLTSLFTSFAKYITENCTVISAKHI